MSHQRSRARENVVKRRTPKVVTATVGEERRKKAAPTVLPAQFATSSDHHCSSTRSSARHATQVPAAKKRFKILNSQKKKFKNFEQNIFDIRRFFGDFRETREASPCVCSACPKLSALGQVFAPLAEFAWFSSTLFFSRIRLWPELTTSPRQCQQFVSEKCSTWSFLVGVASLSPTLR